jgi:3D-(3,5/4)-trihydroxycyclohexane-1,2-dione acylhydrolase (decyclizing)
MIRWLAARHTEEGAPFIAGASAIFGHGNIAGPGEVSYQRHEALTLRTIPISVSV